MWKNLMFALSLLTISAAVAAQERRPWSFYIEGGAGIQQLAELQDIPIPEGDAKAYLNKRGIYSLNITTGIEKPVVPNINIGVSYTPQQFLQGRSRVSLHLGNQNISQKIYHATVASAEMLLGYDFLSHPHHDLSLELGAGVYATFNRMNYTWRGLDGDGNQIYVDGIPEQITVDLGWHNTAQLSLPLRVSYTYNIKGHHWLGGYAQGRYIPKHDSYVPSLTASAGIQYRYTLGKKQKYVKPVREPKHSGYIVRVDTVYLRDTVHLHDTVYVDRPAEKLTPLYILFETGSSTLTDYESIHLQTMKFPANAVVDLTGFACAKGATELNEKLALKRLETVKKVLEGRGVKVNSVTTKISEYAAPNFRAVEIKFIEK